MPIFEYACKNCGEHYEKLDKKDYGWVVCPICGDWMDRIMSAASFKINGASEANGYTIQGKDCNE